MFISTLGVMLPIAFLLLFIMYNLVKNMRRFKFEALVCLFVYCWVLSLRVIFLHQEQQRHSKQVKVLLSRFEVQWESYWLLSGSAWLCCTLRVRVLLLVAMVHVPTQEGNGAWYWKCSQLFGVNEVVDL